MFIKNSSILLNMDFVAFVEPYYTKDGGLVMAYFKSPINYNGKTLDSLIIYSGTKEQCQVYMTELEKELAAFGKLIRVEI